MPFLARRRREAEWMDEPGVDPELLRKSLRFIRRINTLLGYTRATLRHLDRFSRNWKPGQTIRIIDLATGSADIPRAILRWADRKGFDVRIVGVDRHAVTASAAALANADPRLQIVQADVFDLPFETGSFDYALTAMFLHHLDEAQIADVLRTMNSLATRGIVVADLLRHYRAYAWITLFTLFANPMVRHDARVSVGQALSRAEVLGLRDHAAITYVRYYEHFGHRFVLAGEKDGR
jgi:2-polyprenyl-3-methyl-5-hydroxy-6-metoxy-1,4-benzoquinol methylase